MYSKISDNLILENKFETLFNVFEYIYFSVDDEYSANFDIVDENSFVDLVRGFGLCDQQSFIFMNLLNKLGFQSRLRDVYQHTYSEIYLNNKWVIADPYYGYIFFDKDNNILDINQIQFLDEDFIFDYLKFTNLDNQNKNLLNFKKIYQPNYFRWPNSISPNFHDYRKYNINRKFFETYSTLVYKIFGDFYFNIYQDLYLNIYKSKLLKNDYSLWISNKYNLKQNNTSNQSFELFYLGRNYQLSNRNKKSKYFYEKNILNYPNTLWAKESYYFLSQIFFQNKNYTKTIELLNQIKNYDLRLSKINYYIGMSYFHLKKNKLAQDYLKTSDFLYSDIILNELD